MVRTSERQHKWLRLTSALSLAGGVMLLLAGCYLPLGRHVVSEVEIGRRDEAGATSVVIHRTVKERVLSPMTENGFGKDYQLLDQYYLKRGNDEQRLGFLEYRIGFHREVHWREIEPKVWPVAGSDTWIALRVLTMTRQTIDFELIVFDEQGRHRELQIKGANRSARARDLTAAALTFESGNRRIIVAKGAERFVFDPLAFTLVRQ